MNERRKSQRTPQNQFGQGTHTIAVFLDIGPLWGTSSQLPVIPPGMPDEWCAGLIRFAEAAGYGHIVRRTAYADFETLPRGQQGSLFSAGTETVHIPADVGDAALGVRLAVDAIATLQSHPEVATYLLVVADNGYLPLIQYLRRAGKKVIIAWWREMVPGYLVYAVGRDNVIDVADIRLPRENPRTAMIPRSTPIISERATVVSTSSEDSFDVYEEEGNRNGSGMNAEEVEEIDGNVYDPDEEIEEEEDFSEEVPWEGAVMPVEEENERAALVALLANFGRHHEIFLTPYLHKLNHALPDLEAWERKAVLMRIEESGAVRIERRVGTPHDYSVVVINYRHPSVQELMAV